jgi:hypothetical protein
MRLTRAGDGPTWREARNWHEIITVTGASLVKRNASKYI